MAESKQIPRLADAVLAVASDLDLSTVLQTVVDAAAGMTRARYAALGVLAADGSLEQFVHTGMADETAHRIGHLPEGQGILGAVIRQPRTLRLRDLREHPDAVGFPPGHPPMVSFLGTPVRVRGEVFGNLYLTEQQDDAAGFTDADEELLEALAAVAGAAIENARLHERSRRRERWLAASQEVTTALLSGVQPDAVLEQIVGHARQLVGADVATVAVPHDRVTLQLRVADGLFSDRLRGVRFPRDASISGQVMDTGRTRLADVGTDTRDAQPVVALGGFGPTLFVPLSARGETFGTLLVSNRGGGRQFTPDDVQLVEAFAHQASLAADYERLQRELRRLSVIDERDRIGRDLQDTVIGQLFSVGLQLESLGARLGERQPEVARQLAALVDALDDAIVETRSRVFALKDPDRAPGTAHHRAT